MNDDGTLTGRLQVRLLAMPQNAIVRRVENALWHSSKKGLKGSLVSKFDTWRKMIESRELLLVFGREVSDQMAELPAPEGYYPETLSSENAHLLLPLMRPGAIRELLTNEHECKGLMLRSKGRVASFGAVHFESPYHYLPTQEKTGYLGSAFTHPDHRRLGLHQWIMRWRLSLLASRGIRYAISLIYADNETSIASVRKMGFVEIGRIHVTTSLGRVRYQQERARSQHANPPSPVTQ